MSAAQLVEELRRVKVSDLLLHTSSMLASIAFGKLAPDLRDLEQARLAIDALDAIVPLLEEGDRRDIQQVIANLKLDETRVPQDVQHRHRFSYLPTDKGMMEDVLKPSLNRNR